MARKARWVAPPNPTQGETPVITPDTPVEVVRQIFARRLWSLLVKKGWNQSQLSREAGVARDSISTYVRGLAMPDPVNAKKIADALGVSLEELNPATQQMAVAEALPAVELKQSVGNPGMAWMRVNREVPFEIAVEILALLKKADAHKS